MLIDTLLYRGRLEARDIDDEDDGRSAGLADRIVRQCFIDRIPGDAAVRKAADDDSDSDSEDICVITRDSADVTPNPKRGGKKRWRESLPKIFPSFLKGSADDADYGPGLTQAHIDAMLTLPSDALQLRDINRIVDDSTDGVAFAMIGDDYIFADTLRRILAGDQLNDCAVNAYFALLQSTVDSAGWTRGRGVPKCCFLNSFFWDTIFVRDDAYSYIDMPKLDFAEVDMVIVPFNINQRHWRCLVIDARRQVLWHLDSLSWGVDVQMVECTLRWYTEMMHNRYNVQLEGTLWRVVQPSAIPQQNNNVDCGVFALMYAYSICVGGVNPASWKWGQADMPTFRHLLCWSIMRKRVLPCPLRVAAISEHKTI